MMVILAVIFGIVGICSAMIGLGGGTFYLIFMEAFHIPTYFIPVLALSSNIIVSGVGSSIRLIKKEALPYSLLMLIVIPSMISAYLGARITITAYKYRVMLNVLLLLILLVRIILQYRVDKRDSQKSQEESHTSVKIRKGYLIPISALIGGVSGFIGIGGGIILGPVLYLLGMSYKHIPLITAMYIFLNSSVGFLVHIQKISMPEIYPYLFLPAISVAASLFSMYVISYKISVNQVKIVVMITIGAISLYNLVRVGGLYV